MCQKINKGPLDCSDRASVCRKSASGDVQVLGLVHTQKLDVSGTAGASWLGRGEAGAGAGGGGGGRWLLQCPAGSVQTGWNSQALFPGPCLRPPGDSWAGKAGRLAAC